MVLLVSLDIDSGKVVENVHSMVRLYLVLQKSSNKKQRNMCNAIQLIMVQHHLKRLIYKFPEKCKSIKVGVCQ